MKKRPQTTGSDDDGDGGQPMWIVSFTDMITLLLAFFVLLQAFAADQDPDLFHAGQGSFRRAIEGLGMMTLLFGQPSTIEGVERKRRHPTEEQDEEDRRRVLDAEDDRIREIFRELRDMTSVRTADHSPRTTLALTTGVRFGPGEATLSEQDAESLDARAADIARTVPAGRRVRVNVIAGGADCAGETEAWWVSARRASAAAACLGKALRRHAPAREWTVRSWGCGRGRSDGTTDETLRITIEEGAL